MPSVSGWALQHRTLRLERVVPGSFYALGFGLGFATATVMGEMLLNGRFYALGFGLGFATGP